MEMRETPFFVSILRRTKSVMKQKTILIYSLDLALSNKYLEVVIQCLDPKNIKYKGDVSIFFIE